MPISGSYEVLYANLPSSDDYWGGRPTRESTLPLCIWLGSHSSVGQFTKNESVGRQISSRKPLCSGDGVPCSCLRLDALWVNSTLPISIVIKYYQLTLSLQKGTDSWIGPEKLRTLSFGAFTPFSCSQPQNSPSIFTTREDSQQTRKIRR